MIAQVLSRFLVVTTLLALVGLGAASAQGMAPDKDEMAREATLLIMGATLDDLCEDGGLGHVHDCPLCHKLPSAPETRAPSTALTLAVWDGYPASADLLSGPTGLTRDGAPRAPPASV